MKVIISVFDFFLRRHRSLTVLTVIFFASVIAALSTGFWLPARLAYVIALAVPLTFIWARLSLFGLEANVERRSTRLEQGQDLEERLFVSNSSRFSKLWLEVDDPSDLPGHKPARVVRVSPRKSRSWRVTTCCIRRGLYTAGPIVVGAGDPFGLFQLTRRFGYPQSVLVYPKALDLQDFHIPAAQLPAEKRLRRPAHHVTPNASGIRAYEYGDSYNRIHWPSTARTGDIMVKLFDIDPASEVWLLLDTERKTHAGRGDRSTEEYMVTIAASLARYFTALGRPVGLMSFGATLNIVEPERGIQQYIRLLESLAIIKAEGEVPLAGLIDKEGKRFGRQTTLVAITPSTSEDWVVSLQALAGRGVRQAAVLLEPGTFGAKKDSLVVFGALTAAGIQTYLIKASDDVAGALSAGTEARQETGTGRRP